MALGLHAVNLANKWLDMLAGTAFTAPPASALRLHTGDPGAAGTSALSAEATRKAMTWSVAAGGVKAVVATFPSWAAWSAGSETLSHGAAWDSVTTGAGNFLYSFAFTVAKPVTNGDTVNLTAHSFTLTPLAA
jgi:hypothetical protein